MSFNVLHCLEMSFTVFHGLSLSYKVFTCLTVSLLFYNIPHCVNIRRFKWKSWNDPVSIEESTAPVGKYLLEETRWGWLKTEPWKSSFQRWRENIRYQSFKSRCDQFRNSWNVFIYWRRLRVIENRTMVQCSFGNGSVVFRDKEETWKHIELKSCQCFKSDCDQLWKKQKPLRD